MASNTPNLNRVDETRLALVLNQLSLGVLRERAKISNLENADQMTRDELGEQLAAALFKDKNKLNATLIDLLNGKTISELKTLAKKHNLVGYSSLNKEKLVSKVVNELSVSEILDALLPSSDSSFTRQNSSKGLWQRLDTWQKVVVIIGGLLAVPSALWTLYVGVRGFYIGPSPYSQRATATAQIKSATEEAYKYLPQLEGRIIISESPDWDSEVDKATILAEANQLLDVPSEVRRSIGRGEESNYVWLLVNNTNTVKESCGKNISIRGPVYRLSGVSINPDPDEVSLAFQHAFPQANVTTVVSTTETLVVSLEGQLLGDAPVQSAIMLNIYPRPKKGTGTICGGQSLGIPIAAFRYTSEDGLSPIDYFDKQLNINNGEIDIVLSLLATVSSSSEEAIEYLIRVRTWFPSTSPY